MKQEFKHFVSSHYVTSSPVKRRLLENRGYQIIKRQELLDNIGRAEGNQELFVEDNNPEKPVVLDIARKKAESLLGYSQLVATFGGTVVPLVVNDTVWNFASFNPDGKTRTIINKPTGGVDIERLKKFYKDSQGALVYSSAGLCVVMPDPINPIPYSILTKLRVGEWTGRVPEDFNPNPNYSFGMDTVEALKNGYIEPHEEMKFELIFFDDTTPGQRVQSNFATRIPFTGDDQNLELAHALGSGIVPEEIFEHLQKPLRVQQYSIKQ